MNPYYYVFARIYRMLNRKRHWSGSEWNVVFALTLGVCLNLMTIYIKVFKVTSEGFNKFHKVPIVAIGLTFFLFNCYLFIYKDKYKRIISAYKGEPTLRKTIFGILIVLYFMVTFALIIFF